MNSKVYKWCAVPQCSNTSIKTPNKVFVHVPNKKLIRDKWLKLARRNPNVVCTKSPLYFCEDHFDLPNDMENYMEYHVMGTVSVVRMKPGCTPTIFICQPDRKTRTSDTTERPYIIYKKRRLMILEECGKQSEEKSKVTEQSSSKEIASSCSVEDFSFIKEELEINDCLERSLDSKEEYVHSFVKEEHFEVEDNEYNVAIKIEALEENHCSEQSQDFKEEDRPHHIQNARSGSMHETCPHCKYSTTRTSLLNIHLELVHGVVDLERKCPHCNFRTSNDSSFTSHLKTHSRNEYEFQMKCAHCNYAAGNRSSYVKHVKSHSLRPHLKTHLASEGKIFKCHYDGCAYGAAIKPSIENHLLSVHNELEFALKCELCDFQTANKNILKTHMKKHIPSERKEFKCKYEGCPYVAASKLPIKIHLLSEHNELVELAITCEQCNYQTASPWNLKKHMKKHIPSERKKFKCQYEACAYAANQRASLRAHLYSVHNELKFALKCEHCNYQTSSSSNLRKHIQTHLSYKERRYKCHYEGCDYGAATKGILKSHLFSVHNDLEFAVKCEQCDYQTGDPAHLKQHMQTHLVSGRKKFKCHYEGCAYDAIEKRSLTSHLYSVHNELEVVFKCKQCNYQTGSYVDFKRHLQTHLPYKERRCKCHYEGCDYGAATKHILKIHLFSVHKALEFAVKCEQCDYQTVGLSKLKRHMKVHLPTNKKRFTGHCNGNMTDKKKTL